MKHLLCSLSLLLCLHLLKAGIPVGVGKSETLKSDVTRTNGMQKGSLRLRDAKGSCPLSTAIYVDKSSRTSIGNGSSWLTPYKELSTALAMVQQCSNIKTVYVAKGTYKPSEYGDQEASFTIRRGVKLYGGYPTGGGTRDVRANPTVLSGANISYHVMAIAVPASLSDSVVVDGFTITGGNANDYGIKDLGDGVKLSNCSGGGIYLVSKDPYSRSDDPVSPDANSPRMISINNCTFSFNNCSYDGAGMCSNSSLPIVTNCTFLSNSCASYTFNADFSTSGAGAGITSFYSSPLIRNCVFLSNSGVAISNNAESIAILNNCTIYSNKAGIYNSEGVWYEPPTVKTSILPGSCIITNCIVWKNTDYGVYTRVRIDPNSGALHSTKDATPPGYCKTYYSDVQKDSGLVNLQHMTTVYDYSVSVDPLFTNIADPDGWDNILGTADDGLRLQSTSPLINKGSNSSAGATVDLTGAPRIQGGAVDMGAYESPYTYVVTKSANSAFSTAEAGSLLTRSITAYPNLITGSSFNLQLVNQEKGSYHISLYNSAGQAVLDRRIEHSGGSAVQRIRMDKRLPSGVFYLQVSGKNTQATITLYGN